MTQGNGFVDSILDGIKSISTRVETLEKTGVDSDVIVMPDGTEIPIAEFGYEDTSVDVYRQATEPTGLNSSTDVGNLWYKTVDGLIVQKWFWDGHDFIQLSGDESPYIGGIGLESRGAAALAGGRDFIRIFQNVSAPVAMGVGDLWRISDIDVVTVWTSSGAWEEADNNIVNATKDAISQADMTDGYLDVYYMDGAPPNQTLTTQRGNLWYDTNDSYISYTWDGANWVNYSLDRRIKSPSVVPPQVSPTPTVTGGITELHVRAPYAEAVDAFSVEYHISTDINFVPTAGAITTLANRVAGTGTTIRTLPDGTPLEQGTSYYIRTIAVNTAGSAPPSDVAVGQLTQITSPDIAVSAAWVGTMTVDRLTGGIFDADTVIGSGEIVAQGSGGEEVALRGSGFSVRGTIQPGETEGPELISFPTDGGPNIISSTLQASTLTVIGDPDTGQAATLRGSNSLETSASLTLQNSIIAPLAGPTLSTKYTTSTLTMPAPSSGTKWLTRGQGDTDGTYIYLTAEDNTYDHYIVKTPQSGGTSGADKTFIGASDPIHGTGGSAHSCTVLGTNVWVAWETSAHELQLRRYDTATLTLQQTILISAFTFHYLNHDTWQGVNGLASGTASITNDSTSLYVAYRTDANSTFAVKKYSTAGTLQATYSSTIDLSADGDDTRIRGMIVGTFDFGVTRFILNTGETNRSFSLSGSTLTQLSNENWPTAQSVSGTILWNATDSIFMSWPEDIGAGTFSSFTLYKYTSITWLTESSKWWVATTFYDPTNVLETVMSPKSSITMKKRSKLSITTVNSPVGASRIYLGRGSSAPAIASMFYQVQITNTSTTRTSVTFASGNPPAVATFPAATPAEIISQAINDIDGLPEISITGDGRVLFGKLLLRATTDANTSAGNEPPLRIGSISGQHIRMDGNEIVSMAGDATQGWLGLNSGGSFSLGKAMGNIDAWNRGSKTADPNASGEINVVHGLGQTPGQVYVSGRISGGAVFLVAGDFTSTSFNVRVYGPSGNIVTTGSRSFDWLAIA